MAAKQAHLNLRLSSDELRELVAFRQALERVEGRPLALVAALRRAIASLPSTPLDLSRIGATRSERVDLRIDASEAAAFEALRQQLESPVADVLLGCVRQVHAGLDRRKRSRMGPSAAANL